MLRPAVNSYLAAAALSFLKDKRANIAVIFALVMVPTIYLLGATLDYTMAIRKRAQLNSATDAAVLAAVTPSMMAQNTSSVMAAATSVFNATAQKIAGLSAPPTLTLNISSQGLARTVTASYSAFSTNTFPNLLGSAALPISGTASATSTAAPNINFYLLLDDSPSMAIAGTPSDIATMVSHTSAQGGCAFACHETNPAADNLGNPGGIDNYTLARNLGVTLRTDLLVQAVATGSPVGSGNDLIDTATATAAQNGNTYKMAIYTFDYALNTIFAPSGSPSANLTAAQSAAAAITPLTVYDNDCLTVHNCNQDTDTDFSSAMQALNLLMPNPGGGSSNAGDTPQEVVFLVTDGVEDKVVSGSSSCSQPVLSMGSSQYRCQQPIDTTWCTTVKNRGIRIAVLYTEYLALPTNSWYNSYIAPFNSPSSSSGQIATNLQSCASPGLFTDVQTGGDIAAALNALFKKVVTTAAHLTQ